MTVLEITVVLIFATIYSLFPLGIFILKTSFSTNEYLVVLKGDNQTMLTTLMANDARLNYRVTVLRLSLLEASYYDVLG